MKKLLFTHNTNIPNGLNMLTGEFKNLRCCEDDGTPIGLGIQFRHGLDSQYGEIKFIMKDGFEKNKMGIKINKDESVEKINRPFYYDFFEQKEYRGKELEKKLDQEYKQFKKRPTIRSLPKNKPRLSPKDKKIVHEIVGQAVHHMDEDFQNNSYKVKCKKVNQWLKNKHLDDDLDDEFLSACFKLIKIKEYEISPYGNPCQTKSESKYSWCHIQLHLGENIPFTDVKAVLIPKFVLYLDDLTINDIPAKDFLYQLNNSEKVNGEKNPFYHKLYFVGPKDYSKYYSYISPELLFENTFYIYLRNLNERELSNGKKVKDLRLLQDLENALKEGTRAGRYSSSQLSSTRKQFHNDMKVYMDILNDKI